MFQFEHITHLAALGVIPLLVLIYFWHRQVRKKNIQKLGNSTLVLRLMPQEIPYRNTLKFSLFLLALVCLIVAWANPQWGIKQRTVERQGIDVFIALDVSKSMLAEDISPSRLIRAQNFTKKLIRQLRGERIGTIIFAGHAYLQMPLTQDFKAAEMFINSATPDQVPTQGTAIVEAIDLAERTFMPESKNHKVLIIISDGENHDQEAIDRAKIAQENGLIIFAIGVGTPSGATIPIVTNAGRNILRDKQGNPVITQLNTEVMKALAQAGKGSYFPLADDSKVAKAIEEAVQQVEKRKYEMEQFEEYESYFQFFLAPGIILLLISLFLNTRKE